jgi:hypothetical protein
VNRYVSSISFAALMLLFIGSLIVTIRRKK